MNLTSDLERLGLSGNWEKNEIAGSSQVHQGHNVNIYKDGDPKSKCMILLSTNYERGKNRNRSRVPKTCEWFLNHEKFISWRDSSLAGALWVPADPGCGKSVLSKALIDEDLVKSRYSQSTLCYFFFKEDDPEGRKAETALCALIDQIFRANPSLIEHAMLHYERLTESLRTSFTSLWAILESIAKDLKAGPIVCIMDALDECEEGSRNDLIKSVTDFIFTERGANTQLKFLMTSRPYIEIEGAFRRNVENLDSITLRVDKKSQKIGADICLVIEDEVPKIFKGFSSPPNLDVQNLVIEKFKSKENRAYLWPSLVLDDLRKTRLSERDEILDFISKIPQNLDMAYGKLLDRILCQHQEEAETLFHVILAAERPLDLQEMNIVLAIAKRPPIEGSSFSDIRLKKSDEFMEFIKTIGGSFISVRDSKIYLMHQTARDFLTSRQSRPSNRASQIQSRGWKNSFQPTKSHLKLAKICIAYLLLDDFEKQPLIITNDNWRDESIDDYADRFPLLKYAGSYWHSHFRGANFSNDNAILRSAKQLCKANSARCWTWIHTHQIYQRWDRTILFSYSISTFEVAAYFGITPIVKTMISRGMVDFSNCKPPRDASELVEIVVREGYVDIVKLLVDSFADAELEQALSLAASTGHLELVKLLANGCNFNKQMALTSACGAGHMPVIEYLINEAHTKVDNKALCSAAHGNQPEVIKLLVESHRINVNPKEKDNSMTPLFEAIDAPSTSMHLKTIKVLFELGADPNSSYNGKYALESALERRDLDILKAFINAGANLNIKTKSVGDTVFHLAASHHSFRMLEFVMQLRPEANLNQTNNFGETLLIRILRYGGDPEEVIKYCTKLRAQVNQMKNHGNKGDHIDPIPILAAVRRGWVNVVKHLMNLGARISKLVGCISPLMNASVYDKLEIARIFVEAGVDIDEADQDGMTALNYAAENSYVRVYQYLLGLGADQYYLKHGKDVPQIQRKDEAESENKNGSEYGSKGGIGYLSKSESKSESEGGSESENENGSEYGSKGGTEYLSKSESEDRSESESESGSWVGGKSESESENEGGSEGGNEIGSKDEFQSQSEHQVHDGITSIGIWQQWWWQWRRILFGCCASGSVGKKKILGRTRKSAGYPIR